MQFTEAFRFPPRKPLVCPTVDLADLLERRDPVNQLRLLGPERRGC